MSVSVIDFPSALKIKFFVASLIVCCPSASMYVTDFFAPPVTVTLPLKIKSLPSVEMFAEPVREILSASS